MTSGTQRNAGLRGESVVVLDSAEDGESNKLAGLRWRLSQFRVRVGNAVDGL